MLWGSRKVSEERAVGLVACAFRCSGRNCFIPGTEERFRPWLDQPYIPESSQDRSGAPKCHTGDPGSRQGWSLHFPGISLRSRQALNLYLRHGAYSSLWGSKFRKIVQGGIKHAHVHTFTPHYVLVTPAVLWQHLICKQRLITYLSTLHVFCPDMLRIDYEIYCSFLFLSLHQRGWLKK